MMKGTNKLILCPAEMIQAVQFYLDHHVFKEKYMCRVADISMDSTKSGPVFVITLKEISGPTGPVFIVPGPEE